LASRDLTGSAKLTNLQSFGVCQLYGIKPELRVCVAGFHMDVRRLRSFVAEEEESKPTFSKDGWHTAILRRELFRW